MEFAKGSTSRSLERRGKERIRCAFGIEALPSETLLHIASHLASRDVAAARATTRHLKQVFSSDLIWRERCQAILRRGPPIESVNVVASADPVEPWSTAFDPTSELHDPFDGNTSFDWPVKPGLQAYAGNNETVSDVKYSIVDDLPPLSSFPGARCYYDVFALFVYPFGRLLGWWMSDCPSFGMSIRIVFARGDNYHHTSSAPEDCIPAEHVSPRKEAAQPTFLCQKVQVIDRLRPTRHEDDYTPDWCLVTGLDHRKYGNTAHGRAVLNNIEERIDLLYPGVKTEPLWEVTWEQVFASRPRFSKSNSLAVAPMWKGWDRQAHVISADVGMYRMPGEGFGSTFQSESDSSIEQSQPSLLAQARALFATSRTNYLPDEERLFRFLQMSMAGRHPLLPHLRARHANALQVENETHTHTVWLTSGAACTAPRRLDCSNEEDQAEPCSSSTISVASSLPYALSDTGLGFTPSSYAPAPAIAYPPPALLPLLRDASKDDKDGDTESYYEMFLQNGKEVMLPTLSMEPSPPYKLMPHFMDPLPFGPRFFPIRSPSLMPAGPLPTCERRSSEMMLDGTSSLTYHHPQRIPARIDPGSEAFDWSSLEGLFAMSYGPWGQEILYLRTRELTIHDFESQDPVLEEVRWSQRERHLLKQKPTGPHGLGHLLDERTGQLEEQERWGAEPFVSRISPRDGSLLPFIRPGCRVLEATKCTGDANVPRGAVTFRAFSKGAASDPRKEYTPPEPDLATHSPWTGEVDPLLPWGVDGPRPGRVLQHATGRLAPHLFVGGGNFRSCTIFLASPDEIYVCWHDLGKIAVAKRLTAC